MILMSEKVYSVKEVMDILKIARRTVYNAISDGELLGTKVKGKWQFTEEQIMDFVKGKNRKG